MVIFLSFFTCDVAKWPKPLNLGIFGLSYHGQHAGFCREDLAQLGAKRERGRPPPPCAGEDGQMASAGEG